MCLPIAVIAAVHSYLQRALCTSIRNARSYIHIQINNMYVCECEYVPEMDAQMAAEIINIGSSEQRRSKQPNRNSAHRAD